MVRAVTLDAGERLDEVVVVEDVALARGEQPQDLLLELVEQLGVVGKGDDELILLLLELRPLLAHDEAEQLVLQPRERHGEVDERDLDAAPRAGSAGWAAWS